MSKTKEVVLIFRSCTKKIVLDVENFSRLVETAKVCPLIYKDTTDTLAYLEGLQHACAPCRDDIFCVRTEFENEFCVWFKQFPGDYFFITQNDIDQILNDKNMLYIYDSSHAAIVI